MSDGPLVGVRREGAACVLELNRPEKLNALSAALEAQLAAALGGEEVRESACVVVCGRGRAFCAGADIQGFGSEAHEILDYYRGTGDVYERIADLPQPTIAAIHGYCLGGGLELALACDFRVADETAMFGLPEVGLGIVPSSGGLMRVVRMVGPAKAKELAILRDRVAPPEALRLGLVGEVVAAGAALPRALELAAGIAALPPLATQVAKAAIDAIAESPRSGSLLVERLAFAALAPTADAQEAGRAFAEKRPPRFRGR